MSRYSGSKRILISALTSALLLLGLPAPAQVEPGDLNGDGVCDAEDAYYLLEHIYQGGPPPVAPPPDDAISGRVWVDGMVDSTPWTVRLAVCSPMDIFLAETSADPTWGTFRFPVRVAPTDWVLIYIGSDHAHGGVLLRGSDVVAGAPIDIHRGALTIGSSMGIAELGVLDASVVADPAVPFDWDEEVGLLALRPGTSLHLAAGVTVRAFGTALPALEDLVIGPLAELATDWALVVERDLICHGTVATHGGFIWMAGSRDAALRAGRAALPGVVINKQPGAAVRIDGEDALRIHGDLIVNCGRLEPTLSLQVTGTTTISEFGELEISSGLTGGAFRFDGPLQVCTLARATFDAPGGQLLFGSSVEVWGTGSLELRGAEGWPLRIAPTGAFWTLTASKQAAVGVSHVRVRGSDASGGATIFAEASIDEGRNVNWIFSP